MANIEVPAEYKMSERGIAFLKNQEGFRGYAYQDSGGKWTIGYGHTESAGGLKPGINSKKISKEEGDALLRIDLPKYENIVRKNVRVPLNQNQFDALVSFVYNVGPYNFKTSALLSELNKGNYDAVPDQLRRWIHVKKKPNDGLKNRRESEVNVWSGESYTPVYKYPEKDSSNNVKSKAQKNKNVEPTDPSTLNGQTQSSVNAQRQPPSDNQFHVPETVPQQPLQKGQNIQPPIGAPLNNTRSHGSDWPQNFDGAPSDPRGPFRVPQYTPNPNSNTPNNWPQPVRKKTSLFGSLGNIFKRNPTEVQQLGPTQLSPNQQQWNNSTESQQTDFRQLPLNQQPSTQHENIFKRIFNFLRFNIFHGGSR